MQLEYGDRIPQDTMDQFPNVTFTVLGQRRTKIMGEYDDLLRVMKAVSDWSVSGVRRSARID